MITWNDLTPLEQMVLGMLPISFLSDEREIYNTYQDVIHRLVDMKLARPTLTKYKRVEAGDYVLAQGRQPTAAAQADAGQGEAVDFAANLDHVSTQWVQLHQELSAALGLDFEPNEDIERYTEAIAALREQVPTLTSDTFAAAIAADLTAEEVQGLHDVDRGYSIEKMSTWVLLHDKKLVGKKQKNRVVKEFLSPLGERVLAVLAAQPQAAEVTTASLITEYEVYRDASWFNGLACKSYGDWLQDRPAPQQPVLATAEGEAKPRPRLGDTLTVKAMGSRIKALQADNEHLSAQLTAEGESDARYDESVAMEIASAEMCETSERLNPILIQDDWQAKYNKLVVDHARTIIECNDMSAQLAALTAPLSATVGKGYGIPEISIAALVKNYRKGTLILSDGRSHMGNILCDIVERQAAEITALTGRLADAEADSKDTLRTDEENLNEIWAYATGGKIGNWDYPAQVVRHVGHMADDFAALQRQQQAVGGLVEALKPFAEQMRFFNALALCQGRKTPKHLSDQRLANFQHTSLTLIANPINALEVSDFEQATAALAAYEASAGKELGK